jgi:hypothetical protein
MTASRHSHLKAAALALAIVFGVLACALHGTRRSSVGQVAPQQWNKARGPVVPHDSFPRDCSICHAGSSWHEIREDFAFDHAQETGVPLLGAHSAAECLRCHNDRGPVAEFAARGCVGCHEDVHTGKLGKNCTDCHEQTSWEPGAEIVRHSRTRFPLVGAHTATPCFRCHAGADVGNFDRASIECVDCHRDQLALATQPDHMLQGWTTACDRCHIPTSWTGAGFNHFAFPLTGQHAVTACTECHANRVYDGTPSTCVACHQDDYDGARNPDHVALAFPTSCQNCHNTSGWEGANFNHTGIRRGCIMCHQRDYDSAVPNHATAGFPTTCNECHSTSSWSGATFDHPQFPIASGRHSNLSCQQCHPVQSNFSVFTCTNCHAHDQRDMDDEHDRVQGYSYQSSACLACHPNGRR